LSHPMREIVRASAFKSDYKRELKGQRRDTVAGDLQIVLDLLASDKPLPEKHRDHPLSGPWKSYRDCHVKPDLVLIYKLVDPPPPPKKKKGKAQKPADPKKLELARLGSHAELFG
jgi:mRNA interferase YafQ